MSTYRCTGCGAVFDATPTFQPNGRPSEVIHCCDNLRDFDNSEADPSVFGEAIRYAVAVRASGEPPRRTE